MACDKDNSWEGSHAACGWSDNRLSRSATKTPPRWRSAGAASGICRINKANAYGKRRKNREYRGAASPAQRGKRQ